MSRQNHKNEELANKGIELAEMILKQADDVEWGPNSFMPYPEQWKSITTKARELLQTPSSFK